jgi:hypothetical protein
MNSQSERTRSVTAVRKPGRLTRESGAAGPHPIDATLALRIFSKA